MDILEKKEYYSTLYDFYESLLTEKQKYYFEAYYFEDMSLKEIAICYKVSRNAIFDQLKKVYNALDSYEEKLKLYDKYLKREKIYSSLEKNDELKELVKELREIE